MGCTRSTRADRTPSRPPKACNFPSGGASTNRRALLAATATTAAALSGCSSLAGESTETSTPSPTETATEPEPTETPADDPDLEYEWRHEFGGWIDAIDDGTLFCREHLRGEDSEGRVVGIDAETGELLWDYGWADRYELYSELLVEDAVYFGRRDDVAGGGVGAVYALERDGTERWTYTETSSLDRLPVLDDGVLYAAGSAGAVRAFDPDDGTVLWENEELLRARSTRNGVLAVEDVVFVQLRRLFGLDPVDGTVLWSYGEEDPAVSLDVEVRDGVAYLGYRDSGDVAAIEPDRTERWRRDLGVSAVLSTTEDRVMVGRSGEDPVLIGLEVGSGEDRWRVDDFDARVRAFTEDRAYALTRDDGEVNAYDVADGTETWRASFGEDSPSDVHVDDGSVFVETEAETLHQVGPDGEVTASYAFEDGVVDVAVREDLYVGTIKNTYRLPAE